VRLVESGTLISGHRGYSAIFHFSHRRASHRSLSPAMCASLMYYLIANDSLPFTAVLCRCLSNAFSSKI
jgi:hypothetical protein